MAFAKYLRHRVAWIVCLVAVALAAGPAVGQTYWIAPAGDPCDWYDASNWSSGVPFLYDTAHVGSEGIAWIASGEGGAGLLRVGDGGSGTVRQSGGMMTVSSELSLGWNSPGGYELFSGRLTTDSVHVGHSDAGQFVHVGGEHRANWLRLADGVGTSGCYTLAGSGELSVDETTSVGGSGLGTFSQTGGSHTANRLVLSEYTSGQGTYVLSGSGVLAVSTVECVGEGSEGVFIQTGGEHRVGVLDLSVEAQGRSEYRLSGAGLLAAGNVTVGGAGVGAFRQTGGTHQVDSLEVARHSGGSGRYELSGGILTAWEEAVGFAGAGTFVQTGGQNAVTEALTLGVEEGSVGRYELSDGTVTVQHDEFLGDFGSGTFIQTGGTHTVSQILRLACEEGSAGRYELSGGLLDAGRVYVGLRGVGTIRQTGGTHEVTTELYVGTDPGGGLGAQGVYELVAGALSAGQELVGGGDGTGWFDQTGGTNTVSGQLLVAAEKPGMGTYRLSGSGQLSVGNELRVEGLGRLEYFGGSIDASQVQFGRDATLAMGFDFDVEGLFDGTLFGTSDVWLGDTTVEITNAARASQTASGESVRFGDLLVGDGATYAQSGGAIGIAGTLCLAPLPGGSGTYELSVSAGSSGGDETASSPGAGVGEAGCDESSVSAESILVGEFGTGRFVQTGGSVWSSDLHLAVEEGSEGTYELSGEGQLSATEQYIGFLGVGRFVQTGGTNTVEYHVSIGEQPDANGTYELSGGGQLSAHVEVIGERGIGRFVQTGGANTVEYHVSIGEQPDANGTYELSGEGQLSASKESIGKGGIGRFVQTGGTNSVRFTLGIGGGTGSQGTYELSGGVLSAGSETIGEDGTGLFAQTGGDNAAGYLTIGPAGRYEMTGGRLDPNAGLTLEGELDFAGSPVALSWGCVVVDLSGGQVLGGQNASLTLGADTLTIVPTGVDANALFGTYASAGLTVEPGQTVVVPAGTSYVWKGKVNNQPLSCAGSVSSKEGTLDWTGGVEISGSGEVALGGGELTIDGGAAGSLGDSGSLSAQNEAIGQYSVGEFTQTGGSNTVVYWLWVGRRSGSQGTYRLSGTGELSASVEYVGRDGTGTFLQTGGVNTVNMLNVAGFSGSSGRYELHAGQLVVGDDETIADGSSAAGTFVQTGGCHTVADRLEVGGIGTGTYELSGSGTLSADEEFVGYYGTGLFAQTGGSNTVGGTLDIGYGSGRRGTYELSGTGELSAENVYVGRSGVGVFTQTGGTHTVDQRLTVGLFSSGDGTYALGPAGELTARSVCVGENGTGRFVQTGGTHTVDQTLWVGQISGSDGTYEMHGGDLSADGLQIGSTGRFELTGGTVTVGSASLGGEFALTGGRFEADEVTGDLTNDGGTLAVGPSAGLTAILGSYTQSAGVLDIAIGGTDPCDGYDVLSVTGEAALAGTLRLGLIDDYQPAWGETFAFLTASLVTGQFEAVEGVAADANTSLAVLYDAAGVRAVATLPGDCDVDGDVDRADLLALEANFGQAGATWIDGDLTGDGRVDSLDYLAWKTHAGESVEGTELPGIPEPATLALLSLGAAAVVRRKRNGPPSAACRRGPGGSSGLRGEGRS